MQPSRTLLFVYNLDSEDMPGKNDHMSRMSGSGGERCSLHAITFSPIGMKKEWRRFTQDLGIPVRFLSRDEFRSTFRDVPATFPAAFLQAGKDLFHFISTEEISRCTQLEDLMTLIRQRIAQL